ncbi:MAG: hypothetical protein EAZ36_03365 [Verrucomicrobia bacterium]|nr:MAG: hypothetical protein EAZ36_03365 [Verrucomicrobiota bacterium]
MQILVNGGLRVPNLVAEHFSREAEQHGVAVAAADVWLDPRGRILVIDPQVGLSSSAQIVAADAVALQLRRRALLRGKLEILRAEFTGLRVALPALYSPTGLDQPLLEAGEFRLSRPTSDASWRVDQASARVLKVPTAFSGILPTGPDAARQRSLEASEQAAHDGLRRVAAIYRRIVELPLSSIKRLRIDLSSEKLTAAIELPHLIVPAHPLVPDVLTGSTLDQVALDLSIPFADPTGSILRVEAETLSAPPELALSAGPLVLRLQRTGTGDLHAQAAVYRIHKKNTPIPEAPLVAEVSFCPKTSHVEGQLLTRLADTPLRINVAGDPARRAGKIRGEGALSPALLEMVRPFLPEKARPILTLSDGVRFSGAADFADGAKLERLVVRATAGRGVARSVMIDRAEAVLTYEPLAKRFAAEEIVLVQGDAQAEGRYEMATDTLAFRFLLGGSFRPLGISGWFSGWWSGLWANFTFGDAPPQGSADIQGVWRKPMLTRVFVGAASGPMRLRELPLDSVATRLQVNPGGSLDVLGFRALQGERLAVGTFTRELGFPPPTRKDGWQRIRFDVRSNLPLEAVPLLFPAEGPAISAPFELSAPPQIHLAGEVHGPDSPTPRFQRYDLHLEVRAPLRYYGFPLERLDTFFAREGDEIRLSNLRAGIAGGSVSGSAVLSGPIAERWLAFDLALGDAQLDGVLAAWREFQTARAKTGTEAFAATMSQSAGAAAAVAGAREVGPVKPLGGKVHASARATGPMAQPLGFSGQGVARIEAADLARIRLLGGFSGLLSELGLGFSTVALSDAEASFAIKQNELHFDSLTLRGPSARMAATGIYRMQNGELEFAAKMRPFEENTGILSSTADFIFSPLTSVLSVELAGTLEKPSWTFTYGPTRLFRTLTGSRPKSSSDHEKLPDAAQISTNAPDQSAVP